MPWLLSRFSSIRVPLFPTFLLVSLVLAGCGADAGASPKPTPHNRSQAATVTTGPIATSAAPAPTADSSPTATGVTDTPPTPTATTQPAPTRPASLPRGRVIAASLRPLQVAAGGALTASVTTTGAVGRVEMYLSSGPGGAAPLTLSLVGDGAGNWTAAGAAPASAGTYHYTVGIYVRGVRTIVDKDGWNITVTGSSTGASGATMPSDIPLAPPFSYGNPVPAVFSAEGRTIDGSEVVSTTRTDVSAATVAQWYEVHFPRAGWSVDQSTIPAAGAPSFAIAATSGGRVCVASYSAAAVHVFYGTLPS